MIAPYWQNYIDGHFVDGGAGRLAVENPATQAPLAEQALANAADIDKAVAAARRCHESGALSNMRPCDRGRMVHEMGLWISRNADEIASIHTLDNGKPLWESKKEIAGAVRYFEYYGQMAQTLEGASIPLGAGYLDFTLLEPYGVSAQIIPWNFPFEIAARSIAAGLATGNACIVKTPELAPLSSTYLARAAQAAGFPPGALNILCGYGHEAGAALAAHAKINQMVFTGSVETGVKIATATAQNIVPNVLELGGKSAAIIHKDADLDLVMRSVRLGIFLNSGQVCSAMSRALVHASIHDEFVERAAALARSLSVGPGIERHEFGPNMGAMISQKQRERAEGLCARAEKAGARACTGGRKLNREGVFLEPTILDRVDPASEIAQTEVFGPVLSVIGFSDENEAIAIANATQYGLVGGVFTPDIDLALSTAKQMRGGQIFINEWFAGGVETPFGGYGKSGYGREKGREALLNYVQTKNIAIRLDRETD
jgi:aldehyde dehydrogenase (NAD+)